MFCPKCGTKNPEDGKFCRSCGTDLGNVSDALTGKLAKPTEIVDRKGKPVNWERATMKIFSGIAFLAVTIALSFSQMGRGWWFWMLIPAFMSLGAGVAQFIQLRKAEAGYPALNSNVRTDSLTPSTPDAALPPALEDFVVPESRYKTGELVPPSVTDNTTKHLKINPEGETMNLPKQ
ncbi:MAG: zinc-ribbon domain-containing protein [Pyrinomonadaceae bacterium]